MSANVIQNFTASLEYELTVHIGDTVRIIRLYDEFYSEVEIVESLIPLSPYEKRRGLCPTFCVELSEPSSPSPPIVPPRIAPKPSIGPYQSPALSNSMSSNQNSSLVPTEPNPYYSDIDSPFFSRSPLSNSRKNNSRERPLPARPLVHSSSSTNGSPRSFSNAMSPPQIPSKTSPVRPTVSVPVSPAPSFDRKSSPASAIDLPISRKPSNPRSLNKLDATLTEQTQLQQVAYNLATTAGSQYDDPSNTSRAPLSAIRTTRMTRPSQPPPPPPTSKPADGRNFSPSFGSSGKCSAVSSDSRKESVVDGVRTSWHSLDDAIAAELASQKRAALQRCSLGIYAQIWNFASNFAYTFYLLFRGF